MNEEERQIYHDMADAIAEEARLEADRLEMQAAAIKPHPRPTFSGEKLTLNKAELEDKKDLLADAEKTKEEAKETIERDVIGKLPENATPEDRAEIRSQAYDILGIPPDAPERSRANLEAPARVEGRDMPAAVPQQAGIEQSRFYQPPAQQAGIEQSRFYRPNSAERAQPAQPQAENAPNVVVPQDPPNEDARRAELLATLDAMPSYLDRIPGVEPEPTAQAPTIEAPEPDDPDHEP